MDTLGEKASKLFALLISKLVLSVFAAAELVLSADGLLQAIINMAMPEINKEVLIFFIVVFFVK